MVVAAWPVQHVVVAAAAVALSGAGACAAATGNSPRTSISAACVAATA